MFDPLDFGGIAAALTSPAAWVELAIVAACFGIGWLIDRRVSLTSAHETGIVRVGLGGVNRLLFPLVTFALLTVALAIFRRWETPFFLTIAIPLTVALAAIRLIVYTIRELFGTPEWLPFSERVVSFTIWGLLLLHFTGILPGLWSELDAMDIPIGSKHVSVLELLKGAVVVILTIAITLWLSGLVEARLRAASTLDSSVSVVISKFTRALLLVIGIVIALQAVGIDLTLLTVFGGALGVGIGLGLQKLASNYISGFAILLDRSIRLGDLITVDNRTGSVAKLTSRYVVVRSMDGTDAVVPNDTLATTTVLNHSYSNREIRLALPVQVSYDSDVERAMALMVEAANAQPRVLKGSIAPAAFLVRFADSGIDLELGVWINDPENGQLNLRSAINLAIRRSFIENDIRIPYPRRDVYIVAAPSGDKAVDPGTEVADPSG
jgi:small-conductance mechanosensitive channel